MVKKAAQLDNNIEMYENGVSTWRLRRVRHHDNNAEMNKSDIGGVYGNIQFQL